ncbi:substrate-binding periplasmic protein [Pseudoalteromonas fenneropenaei]|uniref:Substrate-binding periplasmic protein n=1 Tax=Pseudoalteromonas fenneropenaei TaxID=1737459 RepID=A0ABV7CNU6_9GAMM
MLRTLTAMMWFLALPSVAKQVIMVGVDHAPPYSYIENEQVKSGLVLDILRAMPELADYQLAPVACPIPRCLKMLAQGEIDAMGGLVATPERRQIMAFVEPPYMVLESSYVFYKRADNDLSVTRYEDLYNKRIAVIRGGAFFPRFDEDKKINRVLINDEKTAIDLLLKERVDLVIAVEETADHAMSILNQPSYQLAKVAFRHTQTIYGNLALSRQFSSSHGGDLVRSGMAALHHSNRLSLLVAPYQLPAIPKKLQSLP